MRPLAVLLVLAAPLAAADPLPFKTENDRWLAQFPALASVDAKELAIGEGRAVPVVTHRATDPKSGAVFSIIVAEYPPAFADVPPDILLDGVRDGLKGKEGKVKAEERLDGPHPGRAVRIEVGKNTLRTRLVVVGSRLYQVSVTGPTRSFPEKTSEAFYAAFEPLAR